MDIEPGTPTIVPSRPTARHTRLRWAARVTALGVVTAAVTVGVNGMVGTPSASAEGLRPFDDCDAVHEWYTTAFEPYLAQASGIGQVWLTRGAMSDAVDGAVPMAAGAEGTVETQSRAADTDSAVGNGGTGTNLQEAGVDEPDTMKTRDGLLVTTVGDEVVTIDVSGDEPRRLGAVTVPGLGAGFGGGIAYDTGMALPGGGVVQPGVAPDIAPPVEVPDQAGTAELLLVGDRAVVLAQGWLATEKPDDGQDGDTQDSNIQPDQMRRQWNPGTPTTVVTVVDLADPSEPTVVSSTETEGQYVSARLTDDAVRLVTTTGMPAVPLPDTGTAQYDANGMVDPAWQREWVKSSRAALAEASGDDFLPRRVVRSPSGEVVSTAPAFDCAALSHPEDQSGLGTVTVTTLDPMADGGDLTVDATGVSADGDMVYASTDRLYVATTRGGWGIWDGGVQGPDSGITTELHGFDTTSTDGTPYLASGEVEGWLLGRWALSAEDGMLRVATTRDGPVAGQGQDVQPQAPGTDSAVTILAEGDGTLEQVGQVTGLGKGEQIRAVRWFGDTATVVTFRQTDPLYVVDLSDPAKPTVTGELKVPGYSAYLHPIGDDVLLGVGQDATETGQTTGMQVSTFDIGDPTKPTRLDALSQPNTWTEVESDSRQFSYLPDQRLALMPMQDWEGRSGVQTVSVSQDGKLAVAASHQFGGYDYVQRAMVTGDDTLVVLVASEKGPHLAQLDLATLSETGTLDL